MSRFGNLCRLWFAVRRTRQATRKRPVSPMWVRLAVESLEERITPMVAPTFALAIGSNGASSVGYAVATDSADDMYVTGSLGTAGHVYNFNPLGTAVDLTSISNSDMFIAKYSPTGQLIWAENVGGVGGGTLAGGYSLQIDSSNNVYVGGSFYGTTTFGSTNLTAHVAGDEDAFIAKLDSNGNFLWATDVAPSTTGNAETDKITLDSSGNVYGIGFENSGGKLFVVGLNGATGTVSWTQVINNAEEDEWAFGIGADSSGNVYALGEFHGTTTVGTTTMTAGGAIDDYVEKLDAATGSVTWVQHIVGTTGDEWCAHLALDASGDIYITSDFETSSTMGSFTVTGTAGLESVYVAKLDPSGNFLWASAMDAITGALDANSLVVDTAGNVFAAGHESGKSDCGSFVLTNATGDAYDVELDGNTGAFTYVGAVGGGGSDAYYLNQDNAGNTYLTGKFTGTGNFDPNAGNTTDLTAPGSPSTYLVKYSPVTLTVTTQPPASDTAGTAFPVSVAAEFPDGATYSAFHASITMAIGTNPGGSTLGGTVTVTAAAGVANFSNLSLNKTGTGYTLQASSVGAGTVMTDPFAITADAAKTLVLLSQPSSATAGSTISPVTVEVEDQFGNGVPGVTVGIAIAPGSLSSGTTSQTTDASGDAVFGDLVEDTAGTYSLTATSVGLSSVASSSFIITAAAASKFLGWITQPIGTTAGSTLNAVTVAVGDQFGNPVGGFPVSISIAPGALSTGTTPIASNGAGQAIFSDLSENTAGIYSLTASATGLTSIVSNPFTISASTGLVLSYVSEPSSTTAGSIINPVTVQVVDQFGNPAPGVSVGISIAPGNLSAGTTPLVTNAAGKVVFSNLVEDTAGTYTLTAATAGATSVVSSPFTITAAAASLLTFVTQPISTEAGSTLNPVTLQLVDQFGNAVGGAAVGIALSPGSLSGGTTPLVTSAAGQVVFSNLVEDTAGTYTLTATTAGANAVSNPFTISAATGVITFLSQPSSTTAGAVLNPITVQVADQYGNVFVGDDVGIAIAPGVLSSGTASLATNAAGQVVFSNLVEDLAATYTLTAAVTGLANASSNSFIISAGAFALTFLSQPSSTTAGSTLNAVTVQAADMFGNPLAGASIGVALSSGSLSAGTSPLIADSLGEVVFGDLAENIAGTYTLTASAPGLTSVSSNSFTISVGAIASLAFLTQPSNTVAGVVLNAITVQASDAFGNAVTNFAVGISVAPGALSGGTTPVSTNAAGQAVFSNLVEDTAGTYSLTASGAGVSSVVSNTFIIELGAVTLSFLSQPSSTTAGSTLDAVTVQAADKFGNPLVGASIGIALSPGILSAGTTPLTANAVGEVVFSNLVEDLVGTYTLTAASAGLASISSNLFTISVASIAKLTFLTQPSNAAAGATLNAITVQASDAFGNAVTNFAVGIGIAPGSLSGGTTPVSTNAVGQAVFSNLVEDTAGTYSLTASGTGVSSAVSSAFVIKAGAVSALSYLSQPSSTTAGLVLSAVTIQATDVYANVVPGVVIGISISPGALSAGTTPLTTNAAGQSVFSDLIEDFVGTYSLLASASGLAAVSSNAFTISAAAAAKLSYLSQPSSTTAGTTLNTVTVQVADKFGNVVSGFSIGIGITPGALSTGTTPLVSDGTGLVRFSDLSEDFTGTYSLTASAAGLAGIVSSPFVITSAQAASLVFLSQPSSVAVNSTLTPITLLAKDQFGNLVTNGSVSIALASGALNGATTAFTNAGGQVVFSTLSVPNGGLEKLVATSGTASATSNPFAVTSSADILTFLTQPSSTTAGATLNSIVVQLSDPAGELLPGVTINVALSANTLSGEAPLVSNSLGQVAFSTLSVSKVGTYTLSALSSGITTVGSKAFTISAGAVAKLTFLTQPKSTTAGTTLNAITVAATDQFANVVTNAPISIATSFGTLLGTSLQTTNSLGQVVFSTLSETVTGTCVLNAATALLSASSTSFAITPSSPVLLQFVSQPISTIAGATMAPVSVKVLDKYSNPVPGVVVTLLTSINTVSGSTVISSNMAGVAVFSNLFITKTATYTLSASATGLTKVSSNTFTISPALGKFTFLTQPTSTTAGGSLGNVSVKVVDAYGNPLVNTSVTVRISSGTLNGTTTTATNSLGQVTYTNLSVSTPGNGYTLSVSASNSTAGSSSAFNITAAAAPHLVFSSPPVGTSANATMSTVVVQLDNANGTPLDQANVAVTIKISSGSLGGTLTVLTNSAGQALFSTLKIGSAGTYSLTALATVNGNSLSVTSGTFTIV